MNEATKICTIARSPSVMRVLVKTRTEEYCPEKHAKVTRISDVSKLAQNELNEEYHCAKSELQNSVLMMTATTLEQDAISEIPPPLPSRIIPTVPRIIPKTRL